MNEYPVFVPYGSERLAAVVTVPDTDATSLALLMTGTGAPRSHRFQLWTRAARELADRGIASVRMDYRGFGDSTGRIIQPALSDQPVEQVMTVARFAMDVVGVERLGVVGNCSGGLLALIMAAKIPQCEVAVCILPRLVQLGRVNQGAMMARKTRVAGVLRNSKLLRTLVRKSMKGVRDVPSPLVQEAFEPALRHARILFIYSQHDLDPYVEKSRRLLTHMRAGLPSSLRDRLELEVTSEGPLHGFESLSVQRYVIDRVSSVLESVLVERGEAVSRR
jgi:pimeloyl-ACP methyl ester carboxylesterase